ncbi:S8 family serine peptidase [Phycicoccus sp. Root101]|uniref:S8 family serine peptidase n=1 Tax=Phycicoccus sp. Root101 TaxID=1736421 RepID=UPI00190FF23E|nr:S8 family serine peptidase [Phycicoccus sp. Root101]
MTARHTRRRGLTIVAGMAVAGVVAATVASVASADQGSGVGSAPAARAEKDQVKKVQKKDKLGQHDRQLLSAAQQKGTKRVTLMLATEKGATKDVVKAVKAQGGWTGMVNDRIGYVRASVPTTKVDKVAGILKVIAVDLDESIPLPNPAVERSSKTAAAAAVAAPGKGTPDSNPYMPTRDQGATDFKTKNPAWDGRGVTIGILDSGVDLDHPALKTTSTGERKIVDWVTATDPIFDNDFTWRRMTTMVTAAPTFTYAGSTWTAPASGDYAVSRFSEAITEGSEPEGDVNRDGDTTDQFGVLYDYATNNIWVDANQDKVFTADEFMRPYKERFDVHHFGTDDPKTAVVEQMPFTVEFRKGVDLSPYQDPSLPPTADFVNIGIVEDAHASHVTGIAAGHSLFGGKMDGEAPGAKIVSSRGCTWGGGCTAAALTDGMVDLVANRHVDVVNMSIGGLPALNDGNNARSALYNRLIDEYGVQLFISAGNSGPGVNTIGDPSVATDVVSVASSITKETWLANYGSTVSTPLTLHNYSSRGPREDGGFKPNIMAAGSAISTVPRWLKQPDVAETGYTLPVGYAMFNGTSMASPQAAGGAALLLSAAFATGTDTSPAQLRNSIYSSAKFVKGLEAIGQGAGQMNVPAAWTLIKKRPMTQGYTVSAPVCTPISDFLATPDVGTGVYNRCGSNEGGQVAGVAKTYTVSATRTSGRAGAALHQLRLVGNDGTFTLGATKAQMAKGTKVSIPVTAKTSTQGAHSAILEIDDPATPVVDHRVLLTVVLAKELAKPSYATSTSDKVGRNLTKKLFVNVPAGTKALQVNLAGTATKSQVRFIGINPYGVPVESTSSLECYTNFSDPSTCKPTSRNYANPLPGIWEFEVEARRTSPFLDNPFRLTAAAQGVVVNPETQTLPSVTAGEPSPVSWRVSNSFGPVTVTPKGGSLGSSSSSRKTIADGDQQTFEVVVPAGAERLDVAIGNTSDLGADLDLTVKNAAGAVVGSSADGDSEESVSLAAPAAGTYTVVVDGYSVPAGTTQYDYLDVFFSPALGTLDVPGTAIDLPAGGSTTVTGQVTAQQAPASGRRLFGEMNVVSSEGAVLGTGSVVIGAVTQ